jgi:ABC-type Fe3+-hydroxamate transport system substrate-binding protein
MAFQMFDDMGRCVVFGAPPRRIVSLVPSDTFTLFELGVGERIVGRTRFCVDPAPAVERIPIVGGTKDPDLDAIAALRPDVVIANQEENARPSLEALAQRGITTFVVFPRRVADGLALIARYARMMGVEREPAARELVRRAYALGVGAVALPDDAPRAFVPIWDDPLMTFGDDVYAADVLRQVGLGNAFGDRERRYPLAADLGRRSPLAADRVADRDTRYPRITVEEVVARAPEVVLLPDEPYAFAAADRERFAALDLPAARRGAVELIAGKQLFWYGSYAIEALPRLRAFAARMRA